MTKRIPFSGSSPDPYYAMTRPEEGDLKRMTSEAGALVLIQGPRRIGKTTIIRKAVPKVRLIEANLYGAKDFKDCEGIVASAIEEYVGAPTSSEQNLQASGKLFGFGASAQVKKDYSGDLLRRSFDSLISKAENGNPPVLFLDEAQTVLEAKGGLEFAKRLRTELQRSLHCLSSVFAGSNSAALATLHSKNTSPFYKQFESLHLGALNMDDFYGWVVKRLKTRKLELTRNAFDSLAFFCRDVCGDMQRVLESICYRARPRSRISTTELGATIARIVGDVRNDSLPIVSSLTGNQLSLYVFISVRDRLQSEVPLHGRDAQEAMGHVPSGTITRALESLAKSGLITHWNGRIYPDNPFLEETIVGMQPRLRQRIQDSIESLGESQARMSP